jgi:uncharacterized membrane protein YkoI
MDDEATSHHHLASAWVVRMMQPMKHLARVLITAALTLAVPMLATHARADQHQAKVSMADARAKALALVPGVVRDEELEQEGGRWIYSFEIKPTGETRKIIKEVNIDADTGAVVGVEIENE